MVTEVPPSTRGAAFFIAVEPQERQFLPFSDQRGHSHSRGTGSEKEEGGRWRRASTPKRATMCKRSRWAGSTLGAPRASWSSVTAARGRLSPPPLPSAGGAAPNTPPPSEKGWTGSGWGTRGRSPGGIRKVAGGGGGGGGR